MRAAMKENGEIIIAALETNLMIEVSVQGRTRPAALHLPDRVGRLQLGRRRLCE